MYESLSAIEFCHSLRGVVACVLNSPKPAVVLAATDTV